MQRLLPDNTRAAMALAAAVAMAGAAGGARAQGPAHDGVAPVGCWAAGVEPRTTSEDVPMRDARYRPMHAVLDTLEALVRPNPGLLALPEVRLRIGREIDAPADPQRMPRAATLHALGFGPKAWGPKGCELIAQADRLGPRAGLSIFINTPTATLNRWEHDEQLTAYLMRGPTRAFQGWPTYGECAIVSADRRLPWTAVTVGEMLALYERQKRRELADWDLRHAGAFEPFDLAAAERQAEAMRKHSAQAADAMLFGARQRKANESRAHDALRAQRQHLLREAEGFRAAVEAMDDAQRAAPYHVGTGPNRLPTAFDLKQPKPVVKLDPGFPWDGRKNRNRVQLITVCAPQLERNPGYHAPMRAAVEALDFARLAALLN
jgi:hypothetical protein